MFSEFKYIDKAFKHIRLFAACFLLACLGLTCLIWWRCTYLLERAQGRIYVLAGDKVLQAMASDRRDNLEVEARDHIRVFHQDFYTLDPDEKVINANIGEAFYLADGSARKEYERLQEQNYYRDIIAGNVSQRVNVDSIYVDMGSEPYAFQCWLTLTITRTSNITLRALVTEGHLRTVSRSDNNPHGFLIEDWRPGEPRDIKTQTRFSK